MYGTINNGAFIPAPRALTANGRVHYHPSDELYEAAGYLRRVDTVKPQDGAYASHYEDIDGQAVQIWTETPTEPQTGELSAAEIATRLEALSAEQTELREALELLLSGATE